MEKYSLDYICGFIKRKEPLPKQINNALSIVVATTFNRGITTITLEELLDNLLIRLDKSELTSEYYIQPESLLKLVRFLHYHKLVMIPMSVPNNLPLTNTIHLLKVPDLTQDPDIAAVCELQSKNQATLNNYTNSNIARLNTAVAKLDNFNVLTRVFEGLGAMQTRPLDVNQRSALINIINERILPHDGNRYIRCLFGYVCDYGSYTYDYSNKDYYSQPIKEGLISDLIDTIARVLSSSHIKMKVRSDYPYAERLQEAYDRYCPASQAQADPFANQPTTPRVPVAMRPLSKLTSRQKHKRQQDDLDSYLSSINTESFEFLLNSRPGLSSKFINTAMLALQAATTETYDFLNVINQEILNDPHLRLMLPNLDKCELYVETVDIHSYLKQQNSALLVPNTANKSAPQSAKLEANALDLIESVVDGPVEYSTPNPHNEASDVAQQQESLVLASYPRPNTLEHNAATKLGIVGENGVGLNPSSSVVLQHPENADASNSNGLDAPLEHDKIAAILDDIEKGFTYTSLAQATSTGESFNAISHTWDELTHLYYSCLIYSKNKDYLHPNVDEDYGSNLEQFLKHPLKQITSRLNHTNFFEFVIKPMLTGELSHRQMQFFKVQISNAYLFSNANPLPYLFCHGLFIFDKYLMQPANHFNNEVFYLTLFAREPYAINLYLTRIINKYGPVLRNIPEEFYILIVLQMLLFPQDKMSCLSYELARWLLHYNFSQAQLSRVVVLHTLAHSFYRMVQDTPELMDLKLVLVKDPVGRNAYLSRKQREKQRKNFEVYTNRKSLFDGDTDGEILAKSYKDHKDALKKEDASQQKERNYRVPFVDDSGIPEDCNQQLNPLLTNNNGSDPANVNYIRNLLDEPNRKLIETVVYPILKHIVSSNHLWIYMFDRQVDVTKLLHTILVQVESKKLPDTLYEALPRNRFIIDSFIMSNDPQQLQNLQMVALRAQTTQEIGFAHGIPTTYINEVADILFYNLKLQLVPNYQIFKDGENYSLLRPVVHYIKMIELPQVFHNSTMYSGYKDIMLSLQKAATAIELIRATCSQIVRPMDMIEALVKEVIALHCLQDYREIISFIYNYLNASYKLIDLEGRLNIEALCADKFPLDVILCGKKGNSRLYHMLTVVMNHLIKTTKMTQTIQERYILLLLKLKIKDKNLLNVLHRLQPADNVLSRFNSNQPISTAKQQPISIDMTKVHSKLQESSEVQKFITQMREEEAIREEQEHSQGQIALKERIARYQQQQSQLGTAPTQEQIAAATRTNLDSASTAQESKQQKQTNASVATSTSQETANAKLSEEVQQKLKDLAPVAMKLSPKARSVIEAVVLQNTEAMDLREFNGLCVSHRYMSANTAIEEINDVCLEELDDMLFDADPEQGILYISKDILSVLATQCDKIKELS